MAGADDAGVSIVEVLVAITILALTMTATASSVIQALEVARDSRESVLGANIAQFELERLRSIPFVDWVTSARTGSNNTATTTERAAGPDGQVYDVTREVVWVEAGGTRSGCETAIAGGEDGADYVRVSQTVTFPDRDLAPVTNVSIITPRLSFYDPLTGNLAVYVTDRDGNGAAGHNVTISGAAGLETAVTDNFGCAFFSFLPVDTSAPATNAYDVSITTTDHVTPAGLPQIIDVAVVAAQATTVQEYVYDRSATVLPTPTVRPPAAGCVMTLVDSGVTTAGGSGPTATPAGAPATFRALECRTDDTAVPVGWQARVPLNLGYGLYNGASAFSASGIKAFGVDDRQATPTMVGPLFPFADGYGIAAGRCSDSDPTLTGAVARQQVLTQPGGTVDVDVDLSLVSITTWDDIGVSIGDNVDVYADHLDATDCAVGERLYLGRSDAAGQLRAVLPFGDWVVSWSPPGTPPRPQPWACDEVSRATSCVTLRADHGVTEDPLTGISCTTLGTCPATTDPITGYEISAVNQP